MQKVRSWNVLGEKLLTMGKWYVRKWNDVRIAAGVDINADLEKTHDDVSTEQEIEEWNNVQIELKKDAPPFRGA